MANPRHENNPRQENVTSHTGQESRRPSDTGARSAQAAAGASEQVAQASINAARTAAGAGGHAARVGADIFESTANAFEQLWRSGFDMTSHFAERSSQQVARGMGLSDEKRQQATEQSSRNIDAIVQSSKTLANALQVMSRELSGFYRERVDRNLEKMDALMRSRTPQELLAAQSELFRDNFEGLLQSSRRMAEMSVQVADQATRRLTEAMEIDRGYGPGSGSVAPRR
jgi:hypothetical protein